MSRREPVADVALDSSQAARSCGEAWVARRRTGAEDAVADLGAEDRELQPAGVR